MIACADEATSAGQQIHIPAGVVALARLPGNSLVYLWVSFSDPDMIGDQLNGGAKGMHPTKGIDDAVLATR